MRPPDRRTKKEFAQDIVDTLASARHEYQRGKIDRKEYLKWVAFCRSCVRNFGWKLPEQDTEKADKE